MDAILRSVADCLKKTSGRALILAARMDEQDFLIAMPGSPLKKAERLAAQVKNGISERVKAPRNLVVESGPTGIAIYSRSLRLCYYVE